MAMIRQNNTRLSGYYSTPSYIVEGPINQNDLIKINRTNQDIILILRNTKGQSPNILRKITNPKVKISVLGGLDYLHKNKFNRPDYVERTIYSPRELALIIEYFEKIESEINPLWDETTKCMYIYKTLCENLHYKYDSESEYENNKDIVRSLTGLLYGRLVCSGFAQVFKEMLDRNGIESHYQNKKGHHSWIVAKLDGKYRGLELTWECSNKKNNNCGFGYFGMDPNFYSNSSHDISRETEETEFPLETFTRQDLIERYRKMMATRNTIEYDSIELTNAEGKKVKYIKISSTDDFDKIIVTIENRIYSAAVGKKNTNYSFLFLESQLEFAEKYNNGFLLMSPKPEKIPTTKYKRQDGSEFIILKATQSPYSNMGIHKYWYLEVDERSGKITRHAIYSENDLINVSDELKKVIADVLLSKERIKRKTEKFKGYVGYIDSRNYAVYNPNFEQNVIGVTAR